MYAKRLNKVYPISTPQEKKAYLDRGYDIYDDDGEIVTHSPQRTVPYGQYEELRKKYEALREELAHPDLTMLDSTEGDDPAAGSGSDATPMDAVLDPGSQEPEEEIKTLRPVEDPVPKMGTGKKK